MFEKILVPIDGSDISDKALDLGIKLAKKHESSIEVIHIVEYPIFPVVPYPSTGVNSVSPIWIDEYFKKAHENGINMLEEALESARKRGPKLTITSRLDEGNAGNMIVDESENGDFDDMSEESIDYSTTTYTHLSYLGRH